MRMLRAALVDDGPGSADLYFGYEAQKVRGVIMTHMWVSFF